MLDRFQSESPLFGLEAVTNAHEIGEAQLACTTVYCDPSLKEYCVRLVQRTRDHPDVALGSSPRGSLGLLHAGQARAAIAGRDYVLPDDIKDVAPHVLTHRIMLRPTAELRGLTQSAVVDQVLDAEVVPMAGRRLA
jgi:MoxR-like ATPase